MRNMIRWVLLFVLAQVANALEWEKLSPEARELVPDTKEVVIALTTGETITGLIAAESDTQLTVKFRKSGNIWSSKPILKTQVKSRLPMDVTPAFAEAVLTNYVLNATNSLPREKYEKGIRIFDEFLAKCKGSPRAVEVDGRRAEFAAELKKLQRGMEKIEGEWMNAVAAAVRKFDLYSEAMALVAGQKDYRTNEKLKEAYTKLEKKRDDTAKSLPTIMQERVPILLDEKAFADAVDETTAFLHFWLAQVVKAEGAAAQVIRQMDFDYFARQQRAVLDAYRQAGGEGKSGRTPSEKDMVYVPGGYFLMGKDGSDPRQPDFPVHIVFVSPFLMDKYEVSNEDYQKFVDDMKVRPDKRFEHPDAPPLKKHDSVGSTKSHLKGPRQPVVGVDWFDAYAYANWVSKSLPTEAQWERAAKGDEEIPYPWGTNDPRKININWPEGRKWLAGEMDRQNPPKAPEPPKSFGCSCVKKEPPAPPPPTKLPDETWEVDKLLPKKTLDAITKEVMEYKKEFTSPYGIYHLGGNAAEWVLDYYDPAYYGSSPVRDPQGPSKALTGSGSGKKKSFDYGHVYRGGHYLSKGTNELFTTFRASPAGDPNITAGGDTKGNPCIGFRCVKNLAIAERTTDVVTERPPMTLERVIELIKDE